jgi:Spy/CpxP family protein refolding chaperone
MRLNTLTKSILALATVACLSLGAFAERKGGGWEKMQTQLNLTPSQQQQLQPIFQAQRDAHQQWREQHKAQFANILTAEQRAQMEAMKGQKGKRTRMGWKSLNLSDDQKAQMKALRESNRPQMKASREQFRSQVMAVLTPEQQTKWEEMKKNHKGHWKKRGMRKQNG